jgi:cytochrome P450
MVAMYQFGVTREVEDSAASAAKDFAQFMREHIARRRADPRDDLISRLIEAESDGSRLTEGELVTTCILLLNAGHEATVHGIGNGLKAMLERSGAPSADSSVDEAMVEELLRFDAPLQLFTRYALWDIEIAGIGLRQGDRIGLLLGAANRDPLIFADPDRFDPRRAPNPHVAFGGGIHFCVGAPLARLEMRVALNIVLQRLPGLRLTRAPRYRDAYHFHGLEALWASW